MLLERVLAGGRRAAPRTDLNAARERCLEQRMSLPKPLLSLEPEPARYPVEHSKKLEELLDDVRRRLERAAQV